MARDLYISKSHKDVLYAVGQSIHKIDWKILSAKYGWIDQFDIIDPYNQTFKTMTDQQIFKLSKGLNLTEGFLQFTNHSAYDLIIVACSEGYLKALQLQGLSLNKKIIFIAFKNSLGLIPKQNNILKLEPQDCKIFKSAIINMRTEIAKRLLLTLNQEPILISGLIKHPDLLKQFLAKY